MKDCRSLCQLQLLKICLRGNRERDRKWSAYGALWIDVLHRRNQRFSSRPLFANFLFRTSRISGSKLTLVTHTHNYPLDQPWSKLYKIKVIDYRFRLKLISNRENLEENKFFKNIAGTISIKMKTKTLKAPWKALVRSNSIKIQQAKQCLFKLQCLLF